MHHSRINLKKKTTMKRKIIVLLLLLPLSIIAQERHPEPEERMTPEQASILKAKEMRLKMELNDLQEISIQKAFEKHLKGRPSRPKNLKLLSTDEKFELRLAHLEHMQSLQDNLKVILTPKQYEAWKKSQKKFRFAIRDKKKKMMSNQMQQRLRGSRQ